MAQGDYGTPSNRVNITSERWKYTPHTSDPPDTEKGGMWLRVDLDSGDKLATLRFDTGDGVLSIPVFSLGTSSSGVEEVWRVGTPSGVGYVPLVSGTNAAAPELGFQHNGTRHSVHNSTSPSPTTETFNYTGNVQTWTVPDNVTNITVRLWGSGGGGPSASSGGYVEGDFSVSPGETLYLYVGGTGGQPSGGWPNGGDGGEASATSGDGTDSDGSTGYGGGGQTDIRQGGNTVSDIVGAAGGGGGAGDGDDTAADGGDGGGEAEDGSGTNGGAGGGAPGIDGGQGEGATDSVSNAAASAAGGGGGGGSNGGEGGDASADTGTFGEHGYGGGGGDGDDSLLSNTTVTIGGGNTGDGEIEIEYYGL